MRLFETFWIEYFSPKGPPLIFLMFCNTMDVKKLQSVPPFTFFGTVTLFKKSPKNFFMSPKGSPLQFFKNFLQPAGVSQSPKGSPFKFWALDMAPTLAVLVLFSVDPVLHQPGACCDSWLHQETLLICFATSKKFYHSFHSKDLLSRNE